jgi:histidine kinase/histidine kinase/DNA gyrase B/HSP90-like ATPase
VNRSNGWRRQAAGIAVMVIITLLQPLPDYLATGDTRRLSAKIAAYLLGMPLIIFWASSVFGWAARHRVGGLPLVIGGALVSGLLVAALLMGVDAAGVALDIFHPVATTWTASTIVYIGFLNGVHIFGLWSLAFIFPFAAEDARVRALETDKLRSQAELAQLRANFEPHFLLNTLNAVAGLVTEDPREARQLLASLGDLLRDSMRDSLSDGGELQPLEAQLQWLRRYAEILEVRHAGQLIFHWDVQEATRQAVLPRQLLQPLVENAVKHGALMRRGGGEIRIRTALESDRLVCVIEDNGPGLPTAAARPDAFGLASVRRRLALQYAEAASLRLESSPDGTRSIVELPHAG